MAPRTPPHSNCIVWFRQDLRIEDNPALAAAIEAGHAITPAFILEPKEATAWSRGGASRWWLHHALVSLQNALGELGLELVIRRGHAEVELRQLIEETGTKHVFWNDVYEPRSVERDGVIEEALRDSRCEVRRFNASLLHQPNEISNKAGKPFQVFTPFWKHCLRQDSRALASFDRKAVHPSLRQPPSSSIDSLSLLPARDWADAFPMHWDPSLSGAEKRLQTFCSSAVSQYDVDRDLPGIDGTSRLSPYLHFGQLSPRQVINHIEKKIDEGKLKASKDTDRFVSEIGWREFSYHLLYHFPHTPESPLREEFTQFPWQPDPTSLEAWQRGRTGYPTVDAAMRQLWETGWMHNRARMIVASFLVKHLLQPWQEGARWFWDTLVDADLANNTQGWQWTAGCGADASPFFRVFNPITQGRKFDPDGDYIRRWIPELSRVPAAFIHQPWEAPPILLAESGVRLWQGLPLPRSSKHATGRRRALEAYEQLKAFALLISSGSEIASINLDRFKLKPAHSRPSSRGSPSVGPSSGGGKACNPPHPRHCGFFALGAVNAQKPVQTREQTGHVARDIHTRWRSTPWKITAQLPIREAPWSDGFPLRQSPPEFRFRRQGFRQAPSGPSPTSAGACHPKFVQRDWSSPWEWTPC